MDLYLRKSRILFAQQQSDDLFVIDGHIRFRPAERSITPNGEGWFVLPGLVDSHVHLVSSPTLGVRGYTEARQTDHDELVQRIIRHLEAHRNRGVLAVRDAGAPSGIVVEVMKTLDPNLPHLQAAGTFIAPPGRYLPNVAREVKGPDILLAAQEESARGGGWIKFIGDYPHRDHPLADADVGWTVEEVRPAVEAARKMGARIAMHVTTARAAEMAIALDVDSIEHGSRLKPEHLQKMAARGRAWTPTLAAFRNFLRQIRAGVIQMSETSMAEAVESIESLLPQAVAAGVTLLCGSDAALPHGEIALEVLAFIDAGLEPEQAIRAATIDAWKFLGLGPPLVEGSIADFVAYEHDPVADPHVLLKPRVVVRNGRVVAGHV